MLFDRVLALKVPGVGLLANGSSAAAFLSGGRFSDTFRPFRPLSIPRSILPGDLFSSVMMRFRGGDTGICSAENDFKRLSTGFSFSTSEVADTALAFFCCSFLSLNRASIASRRNCKVSSSSSSFSTTAGARGLRCRCLRFGVVAGFFRGEGVGDVRSWN